MKQLNFKHQKQKMHNLEKQTFVEKIDSAKRLIAENIEKYPKNAIACSFGKDSMVLLDIARRVKNDIKIFSVLADTEFEETIKFKNDVVKKWNLNYTEYKYKQGKCLLTECCRKKKVDKFKEAVKGLDLWFSGIRNDEGWTRKSFKWVEKRGGLIKVNPLLCFSEKDLWRYTACFMVPINPLYKQGYRSLSCKNCSSIEESNDEAERFGRWKGTKYEGQECGIHTQVLKEKVK